MCVRILSGNTVLFINFFTLQKFPSLDLANGLIIQPLPIKLSYAFHMSMINISFLIPLH